MKKKTMIGINVVMRSAAGAISTLAGIAAGEAVAEKHNTTVAVASAIGAAAITHFISTAICDMIYKQMVKTNDEDCFVDNVDENFEDTHFSSDYDGDVDSILEFTNEIDKMGESCVDCPDEEIQENITEDDSVSDDATEVLDVGDDTGNDETIEEDPIKVKARELLKMTGGDPSIVGGINANLLKACLDAILTDPALYKTHICDDDGRTYLSGPWVDLIEEIANVALIKPSGRCDWDEHEQLAKLSDRKYFVTAGEVDSFGWLTGVINTPVGIIVYG